MPNSTLSNPDQIKTPPAPTLSDYGKGTGKKINGSLGTGSGKIINGNPANTKAKGKK